MWLLIAQLKASLKATLLPTNWSSAIGNGAVADHSTDVDAATDDTTALLLLLLQMMMMMMLKSALKSPSLIMIAPFSCVLTS